ncbi:MAG: AAA family ATPase [Armatimonadota bacterium]
MSRNIPPSGDDGSSARADEPTASDIVEDLLSGVPATDPKYRHLLLLRNRLDSETRARRDTEEALERYAEAYEKLTAPANRIATYLGTIPGEENVLISVGEQEYVAAVDPKAGIPELAAGDRVRVNDAFAVVGTLGTSAIGSLAKVSEVVAGDRLRIGADAQGAGGRVVGISEPLRSAGIAAGDEIRLDPGMRLAVEHFRKEAAKDFFLEEVPEIPWSRVGGQEEAIGVIRDAIELPLLHPELYTRFGKRPLKGILLYGPPGCGKTLIGKATAYNLTREYNERTGESLKEYFLYINGPKILNMWLGESERQVREIFATARAKAKEGHLVFLFIDEAESILRTRNSGRFTNISNTVVPQFCAEMDGLVSSHNVVVMLTSNRPDYIDPAILRPERIDRRVRVKRPDREAARSILSIYLDAKVPYAPEELAVHGNDAAATANALVDATVEHLWRTEGETEFLDVLLRSGGADRLYWRDLVSGALLSSLVDRAKDFAIKRAIATNRFDDGVSRHDLERAAAAEYKENEIFPKSDQVEDWLLLLDHAPENVADVKPIRPATRGKGAAQSATGVI